MTTPAQTVRTETRERPIAFKPEMVRAILAGKKVQTRRIPTTLLGIGAITEFQASTTSGYDFTFRDKRQRWNDLTLADLLKRCPYGAPGDRLWVKEGLRRAFMPNMLDGSPTKAEIVEYQADVPGRDNIINEDGFDLAWPWKPKSLAAMYCPRWASRITLEVTDVRVQRVQDISEEDARAEGVQVGADGFEYSLPTGSVITGARGAFARLWDSINAGRGYGWDSNCWVWAISFRRITP